VDFLYISTFFIIYHDDVVHVSEIPNDVVLFEYLKDHNYLVCCI
jgi:hypothetical protein